MLGLLAARVLSPPALWIGALAWFGAILFLSCPRCRRGCLLPLVLLAGAAHGTLWNAPWDARDLRRLAGPVASEVVVEGRLQETPVFRTAGTEPSSTVRLSARVRVARLQPKGAAWQDAHGWLVVRGTGPAPVPGRNGDRVRVAGVLRPLESASAPGLFDARRYYQEQGVYYELETNLPHEWEVVENGRLRRWGAWQEGFVAWCRQALARGLPEVDKPVELLWAMLLGLREGLRGETAEPFMRAGTMHLFAISGLHVGLMAMAIGVGLRMLGCPKRWSGLIVIPLLWFYAGATGWQASAVRATLMMSVVMAGWVMERPNHLANSLALAAGLILVWDPNQLFQPGFQLSFMVVLTLVLAEPLLDWAYAVTMSPDPLKPHDPAAVEPGMWRRVKHHVLVGVLVSAAAWLGSLPLVAWHFHYFSPISVPANVVLVPMASLALISGLGSLLTSAWWPAVSVLFNHSAWFWMWLMQQLTTWVARIPAGAWHVAPPPLLWMMSHYVLLVAAGMLLRKRTRVRWAAAIVALLTCMLTLGEAHLRQPTFRLTVLAREGAHMVHVEDGGNLLVDSGDEAVVRHLVTPYLRARGVDRLDALVLTHGDKRHVGGALSLMAAFPTSRALVSTARFRSTSYQQVTNAIGATGRWSALQDGQVVRGWRVLHPPRASRLGRADDEAMVLYREEAGMRILLVSDLGFAGQNELLNRHPQLRADVIVTGLPDASQALVPGFLEVVRPTWVIVGDSPRPAPDRADRVLRERLRAQVPRVDFLSDTGSASLWHDARGWHAHTGP